MACADFQLETWPRDLNISPAHLRGQAMVICGPLNGPIKIFQVTWGKVYKNNEIWQF